ncbi:MAG: ATP-binding protein [Bacteroidota bacterium]
MENQLSIVLGKNKLLKNVDISSINLNQVKGKLITKTEGEILYRESDPADSIYLIISGEINVLKKRTLGKAKSYIFGENEFLGHDEYFEETSRFSTAVALRDTYLISLSREEIDYLTNQNNRIELNLREPSIEQAEPAPEIYKDGFDFELHDLRKTLGDDYPISKDEKEEPQEQFFTSIAQTSRLDEGELVQPLQEEEPVTDNKRYTAEDFDESVFLNEDGIPKAEIDLTEPTKEEITPGDTGLEPGEVQSTIPESEFKEEEIPGEEAISKPEIETTQEPLRKTTVEENLDDALFSLLSGTETTSFEPTPQTNEEDFKDSDESFFAGMKYDTKERKNDFADDEDEKQVKESQFEFPQQSSARIKEEPIMEQPADDFETEQILNEADEKIKKISAENEPKEIQPAPIFAALEGGNMNNDQLQMIIKAAELVNSTIKIDEVLKNIVEVATNLTSADRGTLYILDREKNELWSLIAMGNEKKEIRLKIGEGLSGYVAKTGDTLNIKDARLDSRFRSDFDRASGYVTKTVLTFPIKNNKHEIIGVLQLLNSAKGEFSKLDEELLNAMSIHAALALQNAEMLEKLLQAERVQSLGKMANFLIQDIKKPILVSKRYAEHLKSKNLQPDNAQIVDMLLEQLSQVADLVQTTSSYSEGKTILRTLNVTLNNTLTDYCARIGAYVESRNCRIINEYDKDVTVKLDVKEFYQCYMHIVKNACDAMPDGGTIYISTKREDKKVKIFFRDTGLGIPDMFKDKIFEPFMTHGKKEGTGLGLSITKQVVEAHTGTIQVESTLGGGATFIITLPIATPF